MASLRFTRYLVDDSTSLSAVFPPDASRCGIYVCEFTDGTEYVGQSHHFFDRITAHRRRWPGQIFAIRFAPVPGDELDQTEKDTIARREADKVGLRNNALTGLPLRSKALDVVIDHAVQEAWLVGDEDDPLIPSDRADAARPRIASRGPAARLQARGDYAEILDALATYVALCLPRADLTERRFWSVSNMPSTNHTATHHRLAAISVNNVETFVITENRGENGAWNISAFLNIALDTKVPRWAKDWVEMVNYRSTGWVRSIVFTPPNGLLELLTDERISRGARRLAMGLLRKGSGMMARFHNEDLADDIFVQIDEWLYAEAAGAL